MKDLLLDLKEGKDEALDEENQENSYMKKSKSVVSFNSKLS
jgi:hypothetical protein